jgi:hypothetical protein
MTQPSRPTETNSRDHGAIREIMHQIRDLTVPDRATVAVGVVGHLATMMNRNQMAKLLDQLREEAERVQDVPPSRQRDLPVEELETHLGVGQAGRGEFRSGELL